MAQFIQNQVDLFRYWIDERICIEEKKLAGESKPWTSDSVLQKYFFTNPYREWDKTTVWFRENVRNKLDHDPRIFHATALRVFFAKIPTQQALLECGAFFNWDMQTAEEMLRKLETPFSSAYIISGKLSEYGNKIATCVNIVEKIYKGRAFLETELRKNPTLEAAFKLFIQYPFIGPFLSYEIVTDLRHTQYLNSASDIMTWANPGPGCRRGLRRLLTGRPDGYVTETGWIAHMQNLLPLCPKNFELRDVEHSLCEFDKYARVKFGQGRSKRNYKGA